MFVLYHFIKIIITLTKRQDLLIEIMKNSVAFQTKLASIMEALAKSISKLVEDSSVVFRLEVSRSQKEIDRLRRKLQQVESELRTAQEAGTRESRSVGVQVVDQFEGAGGVFKGGAGVAIVEQLSEKKCKAPRWDTTHDFGFAVKKEQEEESVAQILQKETEHSEGRLNGEDSEYVMFERGHQLWSSFTQRDSDMTADPVCSSVKEQCSQSQSVFSPIQHIPVTMGIPGSTLSSLDNDDHVVDGGVMKEEAGRQCLYTEKSRSEMGDTLQMEHEQPPLPTNDNPTLQAFHPVQQQLDMQISVPENSSDPVSNCNPNSSTPLRPGVGDKRFSCAQCQKRFDRFSDLQRHKQVHEGEKPFSCAHCGMRFSFRSPLSRHERIHTGNKPFCCAQCGRRFSRRTTLTTHERIHTGNKPFDCVHCGKRFAQGSHLKVHNRIHTGERPYHCTLCGKSFNQLSTLKTHQKIHNRNEMVVTD